MANVSDFFFILVEQ